jgi:predicted nucleotidyltransferase
MDSEVLQEIIHRIVEVAQPERIILFGSAARGGMRPDSDLDLLVITRGPVHRGLTTDRIYQNLYGVGQAVDIVVVTPDDILRYQDQPYLIIEPALREGKVIYDRAAPLAK